MKYAEGTMQAEIFKRFRAIVLDEMKDLEPSREATRAFRTATDFLSVMDAGTEYNLFGHEYLFRYLVDAMEGN